MADDEEPMLSGEEGRTLSLENACVTLALSMPTERDQKCVKREQSLEASVNSGLGSEHIMTDIIQAFYCAVWPVLKGAGWTLVKGEGGEEEEEEVTHFHPPGEMMGHGREDEGESQQTPSSKEYSSASLDRRCVNCGCISGAEKQRSCGTVGNGNQCMACRGSRCLGSSRPYFSNVHDVLKRVLERNNEVETIAANAFTELVPDAADLAPENVINEQKDRNSLPGSPSRDIRHKLDHWKDARTHYNKTESRIGPEFNVDTLPKAGSYTTTTAHIDTMDGGALYDRVWDPDMAEKCGKLNFVHTRVANTKKEVAYGLFHARVYRLPGFYDDVKQIIPSGCSDWSKEDYNCFQVAVYEHHENMRKISQMIGKPIDQCITYYLVKFKRTKSYKSLKRIMRLKANLSNRVAAGVGPLVCNGCSKGGMLIACDNCEAHFHLHCTMPPLEIIPEGAWICANCRRETRSMTYSQDEMSCKKEQIQKSANCGGKFGEEAMSNPNVMDETLLVQDDNIALEEVGEVTAGRSRKRKVERCSFLTDNVQHVLFRRKSRRGERWKA